MDNLLVKGIEKKVNNVMRELIMFWHTTPKERLFYCVNLWSKVVIKVYLSQFFDIFMDKNKSHVETSNRIHVWVPESE